MKRLIAIAVLLTLPACVLAAPKYYLMDSVAKQSGHPASRAQAAALQSMYDQLAQQAGVNATLLYSTDTSINAFATEVGEEKLVVVNQGLLARLDQDRDAVAAVLGHELAHHKADHVKAGRRKQEGLRAFGAVLGAVVGAKVGRSSGQLAGSLSGSAVNLGANLLALKFNRKQELEADKLSLQWMAKADYNPQGMLRLQTALGELASKKKSAPILSTHPTSAKRYKASEKLIAKSNASGERLAAAPQPLVSESQLAAAGEEIANRRGMLARADKQPRSNTTTALSDARVAVGSNVHVGDDVRVGGGVRIGGAPVASTDEEAGR